MAKKAQKNQGTTFVEQFGLEDKVSLNSETGILTATDDFLEATLADTDLTVDLFKKAQEHQTALRAAAYEVAGKKVAADAEANKDMDDYSFSYTVGHQTENLYFSPRAEKAEARMRDVTDYGEPNKGEITKAMEACGDLFGKL